MSVFRLLARAGRCVASGQPAGWTLKARPRSCRFASTESSSQSSSQSSSASSNALWAIGSALVFIPAFVYLTSPPASYRKQHGVAHQPVQKTPAAQPSSVAEAANSTQTNVFKYVLVGGGTSSYSAMIGIQEVDPDAEVLIITGENYAPYQRPPLTKELWLTDDKTVLETLVFKNWEGKPTRFRYEIISDDVIELKPTGKGVKLLKGHYAAKLDVDEQIITLDNGCEIQYGKVLLATGGTPRQLPLHHKLPKEIKDRVVTYRTLDDYKHLEDVARQGKHIVVIGGGFLGSELSVGLAARGKDFGGQVSQIFPEEGNMALVFPKYLTRWTTTHVHNEGVNVHTQKMVQSITAAEDGSGKIKITLNDKTDVLADHVVVAVGIEPSVDLAKQAGLEIDEKRGGIIVNSALEARTNVFCAGDNVSFHDIVLGRRRVEHYDNAVLQGRWAGRAMAGKPKTFTHQSMFWSDLGSKIGYEATGILDSSLLTVGIWSKEPEADEIQKGEQGDKPVNKEEYHKGLVFYIRDDTIVGILMFNIRGKVDIARKALQEKHVSTDAYDIAKRFGIYAS